MFVMAQSVIRFISVLAAAHAVLCAADITAFVGGRIIDGTGKVAFEDG